MRPTLLLLLLVACTESNGAGRGIDTSGSPPAAAPVYTLDVVRRWPHDAAAYTQGLEIVGGTLYEGTGIEGRSSVRIVDLASGAVRQRTDVPKEFFGEGITVLGGKLYQLTWKGERGFVYDPATLRKTGEFAYTGEGWGLTNNGRSLVMSDGSDSVRWIDPATFRVTKILHVKDQSLPVTQLNELELIDGTLYANIWQATTIARIDTATGMVKSWINAGDLLTTADRSEPVDVLNGIAWDAASKRLFVTGKYWPALFEVRVKEQ